MPKYEHSRDVITALLKLVLGFFRAIIVCGFEGYREMKKLGEQFFQDFKKGDHILRAGATIALLLVIVPALFQWKDNAVSIWNWLNQAAITARYAESISGNEMQEVRRFFDKYHERFMAHDCEWMAIVGADRAMYDKWKSTKLKNLKCEEFLKTQAKWWLPYKINPIVHEDKIVRISGELVMVFERLTEGTLLMPVKFEIWKEPKWPVWHWTGKPVKIQASIVAE